MKIPDIPQDEVSRLRALRSLNILDTPAEERFDRLTRLAKRIFNVPIAVVSLVDEDRQWFKSCVGLDVSETPRDTSFCGHAILGDRPFIINDANKDARFADNPLVLNDPHISFYAGCTLRHHDGSKMGTLCIIDIIPRNLSEEDIDTLQDLAAMAERELAAVQLATMDELTRISNRRGFVTLAQNGVDVCARKGIPASLVFFDLNGFKAVNDRFGHAEGDRALIAFADHMKNTFRDSDVFARLGGDEFGVLLTDTSYEIAKETIARFRKSLEIYNNKANRGYNISFSDGIVAIDFKGNHVVGDLLNNADILMYKKRELLHSLVPGYFSSMKKQYLHPIALISLVDENRQWFKSSVGLSINETSREI